MTDKHNHKDAQKSPLDETPELPPADRSHAEAEISSLEAELETVRAEAADWRDKFLRKSAEFDNYRKRTRQETEILGRAVAEALVTQLLPIMDDFDRTLEHSAPEDPLRKGVELIRDKLWAFFESQGVQRCDCVGQPFDPELHEAVMMQSTPGFPAHTVLSVVRPGYKMGDRVIRHAQVVVSADADEATESPDQSNAGAE
jgi:molecular chaperone GrpE